MKLIPIFLFLLLVFSTQALAVDKKTYALSKRTYQALTKINELADLKDYVQAEQQLEVLLEKRLSDYERAQTWFIKGSINYQQNKINTALHAFEQVVLVPDKISEVLRLNAYRTLTQLSLSQDKHEKALKYGKQLITFTTTPENDHALLAQAYYRAERYKDAEKHIGIAIEATRKINKLPKENVLLLQNAIYFEFEDHGKMLAVLKELTLLYPKPTYLMYMASVYGQLGDMKNQTILMESLYEDGHLTKDNQFVNLASLYVAQHVPYKGAVLLAQAIQSNKIPASEHNFTLLSQAWLLAAEKSKAINALGNAAKLSEHGELYLRQAYLYFDDFNWQKSANAANKAINKGFNKQEQISEAHLLVAMSLANLKQFEQAIAAGEKALKLASSKKLAQQWLRYIHSEKDKNEQMMGF